MFYCFAIHIPSTYEARSNTILDQAFLFFFLVFLDWQGKENIKTLLLNMRFLTAATELALRLSPPQ
jgi:hypothetical protein